MTAGAIEAALQRGLHFNPCVTVHELRLRMRGWRPFTIMLGYTAVACGAVLLALLPTFVGVPRGYSTEYGRIGFITLAYTQLSLILLLLPAYAAGAISMERERRTLEMLRATLITASDVVTGKLLVVLAFGLMLLITSLPVAAWCLLLGGVAPEEVLYVYTYLFAVGTTVSALGMAYSARMSRSIGAVVATYGTIIAVSVLTIIVPFIFMRMFWYRGMPGAISPMTAFATTFGLALIAAWVAYSLVKAAVGRFVRARRLTVLLALVAALVVVFFLTHTTGSLSTTVNGVQSTAFSVINPYIGLSGLLYSEAATQIVFATSAHYASAAGASAFQARLWLALCGLFLLFAAALYALSIRSFARRPD